MDNIRLYLRDIKHLPLLTQKEEEDIAKRIRKGDKIVSAEPFYPLPDGAYKISGKLFKINVKDNTII